MKKLIELSNRNIFGYLACLGIFLWVNMIANLGLAQSAQKGQEGAFKLTCKQGTLASGAVDAWSAWSKCTASYTVVGLGRLDLTGKHENPLNHVNDFQCDNRGCRAWCIGNPCQVRARCCKITSK